MDQGSEDAFDVMLEIEYDNRECAYVQRYIEERGRLKAQEMLRNSQMGGAADGQPFW